MLEKYSLRAFDLHLARLTTATRSRVWQGGGAESAPSPKGARSAKYTSGPLVNALKHNVEMVHWLCLPKFSRVSHGAP